jgi:hypothetical protein
MSTQDMLERLALAFPHGTDSSETMLGRYGFFLLVCCAVAASCGGEPPPRTPSAPPASIPPAASSSEAATFAALAGASTAPYAPPDEWTCGGDLVPPDGWEQQTSFAPAASPYAREQASSVAAMALLRRLCVAATDCNALGARVQTWKTGSNGHDVCAMAVISKADLEEWERQHSLVDLDALLAKTAGELLGPSAGAHKRVAIVEVIDLGVAGGARADWLRGRLSRLLEKGAAVVDAPKGWAGNGVPSGIDMVVRGRILSRTERGTPTLEATWYGVDVTGARVDASPVAFPESASPPAPGPEMSTLPASEGLSLRTDSSRGGSLCAGERTQLWLEADKAGSVRVLDLYGAGQALVIFPDDESPNAHVQAHQTIAVGGRLGFEAIPVPGYESERFLVISAPTDAALGRFRSAKGPCRVATALAAQLHKGEGLPSGVNVASAGYRITSDPACPLPPARAKREGVADSLASLPICRF